MWDAMFFALCRVEIFIPEGRSLKAKRSVLKGLKERLRARFHAAVAEIDSQDLWQRGTLGVALVGAHPGALEAGVAAMRRLIEAEPRCQIVAWDVRVEPFDRDAAGSRPLDANAAWDEFEEGDKFFGPPPNDRDTPEGFDTPRG
jgi:uncharacterized protein YlxP (DUF503 family)